ncbi:MAG: hypothetical protein KDN20_10390 [Verrucomicrobiae bacterium]|nr:hypothetical protein [Verrucomicrobiae bacterium]
MNAQSILTVIGAVWWLGFSARSEESHLGTIEDFSGSRPGLFQKGFVDSWRWSDDIREKARQQSRLEVVAEGDGQCLRVIIDKDLPFSQGNHSLLRLAPYYPPEADAIRMRIKMISGTARLFLGGPTAYYGNSDVFTAIQAIKAESEPQWIDVEFSLNHPLWRNFRRAGFSTDAPRNYYNRWAQETLSVYVADGSAGEFLIDRLDLVGRGEGRPFPVFSDDQVKSVKTIADFEDRNLDQVFTFYMADGESEWFEQSWKREKPLRFTPTEISIENGTLITSGPVAEEVHCTGVKTKGVAGAKAIRITLSKTAAKSANTVIGMGPAEPIDFLIFVAPPEKPFPWDSLAPSAELREQPHRGFDYQFSYRTVRDRQDLDVAIYQTRRYVKPDEMSTLVIPLADFTCLYGSGAYRQRYLDHQPLTSHDIIAVAWLNPWNRVGDRNLPITTRLDDIAFVKVPGEAADLHSFWQITNPGEVKMIKVGSGPQQTQFMLLPGEEAPTEP